MKIEVETVRAAVDRNRTTWVYLEGKKVYQPNSKVTHPNSVEGLDIRLAALLTLPPSGEQAGSFNKSSRMEESTGAQKPDAAEKTSGGLEANCLPSAEP